MSLYCLLQLHINLKLSKLKVYLEVKRWKIKKWPIWANYFILFQVNLGQRDSMLFPESQSYVATESELQIHDPKFLHSSQCVIFVS